MPEFTVREVRMPELHLPEIKRDEIVRALSGIHIPDVDLTSADRRLRLPGFDLAALPWRKGGLAGVNAGKFVAAAIAAARVVRPAEPRSRWSPLRRTRRNLVAVVRPAPRRSRRRFTVIAIAVAVAVAVGWMLFRNASFRSRLDHVAQDARQWIDTMRAHPSDDIDPDADESVARTASETAPAIGPTDIAIESATHPA